MCPHKNRYTRNTHTKFLSYFVGRKFAGKDVEDDFYLEAFFSRYF